MVLSLYLSRSPLLPHEYVVLSYLVNLLNLLKDVLSGNGGLLEMLSILVDIVGESHGVKLVPHPSN